MSILMKASDMTKNQSPNQNTKYQKPMFKTQRARQVPAISGTNSFSFHALAEWEKKAVVRPLLAGKVKCAVCSCHYVDENVEISRTCAARQARQPGLAYLDKDLTISILAEHVSNLTIERWVGCDNPDKIEIDLRCHCGHSGMYTLKPNPFVTIQSNPSSENYALEA